MKKYGEDELSAIWELVDVELQKNFSDTTRQLWFGDLSLVYIDDSRAILMGNSEFKRNIIEKRYLGVIEDAF
ncbi:MAG TPA: DnaA N-terminal domain-containing protein, partial [Bacillota bacterium]|nr:DnaA N-terminal domain-containing protein [Bacillota bacterium]